MIIPGLITRKQAPKIPASMLHATCLSPYSPHQHLGMLSMPLKNWRIMQHVIQQRWMWKLFETVRAQLQKKVKRKHMRNEDGSNLNMHQ
jgi:hypothetical protein